MRTDLLQRLVVDKTGSIFGDLKLTLLDLLAKFPVERNYVSFLGGIIPGAGRGCVTTQQTSDLHIATQNPRANGSRGGRGVEKAEWEGREGQERIYWSRRNGLRSHSLQAPSVTAGRLVVVSCGRRRLSERHLLVDI